MVLHFKHYHRQQCKYVNKEKSLAQHSQISWAASHFFLRMEDKLKKARTTDNRFSRIFPNKLATSYSQLSNQEYDGFESQRLQVPNVRKTYFNVCDNKLRLLNIILQTPHQVHTQKKKKMMMCDLGKVHIISTVIFHIAIGNYCTYDFYQTTSL